ncbi:MAG: hypothetical protein K0R00_16 [Herbinix sp.]|jgi:hypothetical protein|nr:hypothetical protein [Herbinix sp.]
MANIIQFPTKKIKVSLDMMRLIGSPVPHRIIVAAIELELKNCNCSYREQHDDIANGGTKLTCIVDKMPRDNEMLGIRWEVIEE